MNVSDVGSAIAALFTSLTPPTGQTAIQKVTHKQQLGLGKLPAVIVEWQGTRDINLFIGQRDGIIDFTATIYLPKVSAEVDDAALQAWHDVLIDTLNSSVLLGLDYTKGAYMRSITPDEKQLGEPYLPVLEMTIEVEFWNQGVSLSA